MAILNPWTIGRILKVGQVVVGGVWLALDIYGLIRGKDQKPDDRETSS